MKNKWVIYLAGLVIALGTGGFAQAPDPELVPVEKESEWEFSMAPYFWMAGLEGTEGVLQDLPAVDVNLEFKDIAEALDFAVMLAAEVRHGKWALYNDLAYVAVSGDATASGPFKTKAELEQVSIIDTLALSYRAIEEEKILVDVYAGARIWYVDTELTLTPQEDPNLLAGRPRIDARVREPDLSPRKNQKDELWVDPVVGIKVDAVLGRGFSLAGGGFIGVGGDSDEDWSLMGALNYTVNEHVKIMGGYRHVVVDYQDDGFIYDIEMSGPVLGAAFTF